MTVFDGTPEELASLVPDEDGRRKGYWLLGGVYDTGRSVSIRCEYADGQTRDVVLGQRVERCSYRIDATKTMSLDCR